MRKYYLPESLKIAFKFVVNVYTMTITEQTNYLKTINNENNLIQIIYFTLKFQNP